MGVLSVASVCHGKCIFVNYKVRVSVGEIPFREINAPSDMRLESMARKGCSILFSNFSSKFGESCKTILINK